MIYLSTITDFFTLAVNGVQEVVSYTGGALSKFTDYVSLFPSWFTIPLISLASICIIFRIVSLI